MPKHIFVSYSSKDRKVADEICKLLEEQGIACWVAPRDIIHGGSDFAEQITDGINSAAAMVLLLSKASNESSHVRREVGMFVDRKKPLLPVRIDDIFPSKGLEYYIKGIQWIDVFEPPLAPRVAQLAAAIERVTEPGGFSAQAPSPSTLPPSPSHPAWRLRLAVAFALLVVVGVLVRTLPRYLESFKAPSVTQNPSETENTIAVMVFENLRADDRGDDWYCKALQTNFYTELSKMPQLQIIAPEMIQRVSKESGLDYMAAAKQLGAGRVIAGSFAAKDNILYIGVRILETTTGHQQTAEKIEGDQNQFFDLQNRLARTTLEHFNVRLTAVQEASLHTETSAKPVPLNKYRQFLGAEGVNTETSAPDPTPPGPQARQPLAQTQALRDDARRWAGLLPWTAAYAQALPAANEAAALQLLEDYRQAQEEGNLDRLASLYVALPNSQRQTISAYLKGVAKLRVELRDVKIEPHGQDLAVSYIRRDSFVDKDSGEPVSLEVRVTKFLVQDGGKWKFAEGG